MKIIVHEGRQARKGRRQTNPRRNKAASRTETLLFLHLDVFLFGLRVRSMWSQPRRNLLFCVGWDAQPSVLWGLGYIATYFIEVRMHSLLYHGGWDQQPPIFMEVGMHSLLYYGGLDARPAILWRWGSSDTQPSILEVGMHNLLYYGGWDGQPPILWRFGCTPFYFIAYRIHSGSRHISIVWKVCRRFDLHRYYSASAAQFPSIRTLYG